MKNKFYTSLILGVGLAIASTSSYAKPVHSTPKKHASSPAKQPKKHPLSKTKTKPSKTNTHSKTNAHGKVIAANAQKTSKKHPLHIASKHSFSHHKHHKYSHHHIAKHLESSEPELPELQELDTEAEANSQTVEFVQPTHINARIHSLIGAGSSKDSRIEQPRGTESPRHYISTHGTIVSSLSAAGQKAGLSNDLILQLTDIFAWDIDFATNLRRGDQFTVVYEKNSSDGERIIAAEFVNQGRILTAVRYQDKEGNSNYYTPEGKAMRKAFLSTPVDYARISSHFDANRRHPILNRIRAHKGVDYAARTGTPVKAAGDGKIAFIGRKGGYGQVLIVQHGEHYETLYAHLSNFRRGLQDGDAVRQGEIIGYVGQTGLATGPHLHYEFRVDGEHRNPETQNSRQALTLSNNYLAEFKTQAQPVLSELYHAKAQTLFAKNQPNEN